MKRFCLDLSIVLMAFCFMLCLIALPEGVLALPLLLAIMCSLVVAIRLAYRESVRLEERALRAKHTARRRAAIARHRVALAQASAMQVAVPSAQNEHGLFVA